MPPKPSFEQFLTHSCEELGFPGESAKAEIQYKINLTSAATALQSSPILKGILTALDSMQAKYLSGRNTLLFYRKAATADIIFHQKPFRSSMEKLYRRNVVFNRRYPAPPDEGPATASDIYRVIDDLLRTRLVCKYLDGPEFVCRELTEYCRSHAIDCNSRELSTDAGYYAWHFYFRLPVDVNLKSDVVSEMLWVEMQFTTLLAEAITELTHGLYEVRRNARKANKDRAWKWDAKSQEFRSAYIGHGLHLLEGIILGFRDEVLSGQAQPLQGNDAIQLCKGSGGGGDEH